MKKKRKKHAKNHKIINIISRVIAFIAIVIAIVFCIYIYRLDMLPSKYLRLLLIVLGSIYLILSLFAFPRKIKKGFKIFSCIFFILFSLIFVYGIKYVDKAYDFINSISGELKQREEYYISVDSDSTISDMSELEGKKIGVYVGPSAINVNKAKEKLLNKAFKEFKNEKSRNMISGIAFHWYSGDHYENIRLVRKYYPEKLLFHTEGCYGYTKDECNYHYSQDIIDDLNAGANAYIDWNILLDSNGRAKSC